MLIKYFKNSKIIVLIIICLAVGAAFYVKAETSPGDDPVMLYQLALRDPTQLLSDEELAYWLSKELNRDNRPLKKEAVKVKGIYASGRVFHSRQLFDNLLKIIDETELNAIVIDVKDDDGSLLANFANPLIREVNARVHKGQNVENNMELLYQKNIYPIARVVVFKDSTLAEKLPELAIRRTDGRVWRDRKGLAWVDPHNQKVWEYAVEVSKEAARLGFREIQFDYVRFPTDGDVKYANYPFATGQKKEDVIQEFLRYAKDELEPFNVFLSADVFGLTTLTLDDMGMGQKYEKIMTEVEYICPMVYPSHYGVGNYGFTNPNAHPYEIVKRSLLDGIKKNGETPVIIRPWLQDFTLGSPRYGAAEVRAQIQATYDAGLEEWLLWNAGNRYTKEALLSDG